ncbi:MAG: hypothetical protein J5969_10050 [Lachnospiraceae bacterium]|nr:hypothetical protein [Lachnospiraceae bacterium]
MNILALDVGTTSIRGILYREDGKVLGSASQLTPLIFDGDHIEQAPQVYRDALISICGKALSFGSVDAVSVTAYRSAPALFDREGNPLTNFIMWQDTRNREICESLFPHNEEIFHRTGARVNAVFTASKITWFKENLPEAYEKAYKALVVPDYLIHLMTGAWTSDRTYGSRTGVMDIRTLDWDPEMLALYRLDRDRLPDLIDVGTVAGQTHKGFEEMTGIPAGTPVVTAGGDQQCGALGLGELDSSSLVINCGTGSFIISLADAPVLENSSMICNVSAVRGKYTVESNVLASAAALNWEIREIFPELWNGGDPDFGAFNAIAASAPLGSNGVICVPLFQGCGTRDWNIAARASFSGFSLHNTRADLARSIFEGIGAEIIKSVNALPVSCRSAERIRIGGGLTKSDFFNQMLCDMSGKELLRYNDAQATAIGAFMSAAVELGIHDTLMDAFDAARGGAAAKVYTPGAKAHSEYLKYIEATERVYKELNQ